MSDDTIRRALADAERASLEAAAAAAVRGHIKQRETAPGSGVWHLLPTREARS